MFLLRWVLGILIPVSLNTLRFWESWLVHTVNIDKYFPFHDDNLFSTFSMIGFHIDSVLYFVPKGSPKLETLLFDILALWLGPPNLVHFQLL